MTTSTSAMLESYPAEIDLDRSRLASTVDVLIACAQACTGCADACLAEKSVADLTRCIRTDLDCADVCETTARVLSRHTGYDAGVSRVVLEACATACKVCGDECASHAAMHAHCQVCAEMCRTCEQACRELLAVMN